MGQLWQQFVNGVAIAMEIHQVAVDCMITPVFNNPKFHSASHRLIFFACFRAATRIRLLVLRKLRTQTSAALSHRWNSFAYTSQHGTAWHHQQHRRRRLGATTTTKIPIVAL